MADLGEEVRRAAATIAALRTAVVAALAATYLIAIPLGLVIHQPLPAGILDRALLGFLSTGFCLVMGCAVGSALASPLVLSCRLVQGRRLRQRFASCPRAELVPALLALQGEGNGDFEALLGSLLCALRERTPREMVPAGRREGRGSEVSAGARSLPSAVAGYELMTRGQSEGG